MVKRRQQQKAQRGGLIWGLGALLAVAAVVLVLSNQTTGAAPVSVERLALDPVLGPPNAPVTVVEYGAYACHACRAWHNAGFVEQIIEQYDGQVNFTFRDYPVISPAYDHMAAQLAQCALDQGQPQFWAFHDVLYTVAHVGDSQNHLIGLAGQLGLDADAMRTCADARTHVATVRHDESRGRAQGFPGTPTFVVNGQRVFNASPDALVAAIDRALQAQ